MRKPRQVPFTFMLGVGLVLSGLTLASTSVAHAQPGIQVSAKVAKAAKSTATRKKASGWEPSAGPHFNIPRTTTAQYNLEDEVVAAINHAHKGSFIRFAIYSFDRMRVANALIRAKRRGVHVQLLLNDNRFDHAQRVMKRAFGVSRKKRSFSRRCTKGCRTAAGFLHTKIFLFSHTGVARHVVMLGSLNMTLNSVRNQYNDLWVSRDSARVYSWFDDLFKQMRKDKASWRQNPPSPVNENWPAPDKRGAQKPAAIKKRLVAASGRLLLQAMAWPKYSARNDPIMMILDQVQCKGATGASGSHHRTIVRVSMHAWNGPRGAYIARKIKSLRNQGCIVQMMYGMMGAKVRRVFAGTNMAIRSNGFDTDYDGEIDLYSHQKELMISGHYGDKTNYHLVVTGSSNFTPTDIKGDEILFLIPRVGAYNAYTRNFKWIWANRTRKLYYVAGRMAARQVVQQPVAGGRAWERD